jgi:hypothetical protein
MSVCLNLVSKSLCLGKTLSFSILLSTYHIFYFIFLNRKTKKGQRRERQQQFIHKEGPKDTIIQWIRGKQFIYNMKQQKFIQIC